MLRLLTSSRRISHHIQNIGPAFAIAVATLWLLQISLFSALITTLALAVILQTGRALAAKSGLGDVGLGVGFVVGVGVFVFSGQLLLVAGIPAYVAHWSVLVAMVAVAALISRQMATADFTDVPSVGAEALFALSVALIVLSMRHPWVFPFAIPVAILERYRHHTQHQVVLRLVTASLIPVGWLVASAWRPDRWWYLYQGNDSQFFEAIGWSIASSGVFEHPGNINSSVAAYHWLSYAFLGSLSHVGGLAPWDAIMKIGPSLLAFFFTSALLEGGRANYAQLRVGQWFALLIAVTVMPGARFDSFAFSILIGFVFLVFTNRKAPLGINGTQIVLFLILSVTLLFGKVSTAVVVAVALMLQMTIQAVRKEEVRWLPLTSLIGSLIVAYLSLFRSSSAISMLKPVGFSFEATSIELRNILDQSRYMIQFLFLFVTVLIFWRSGRRIGSLSLAVLILAVVALSTHLYIATNASGYFGLPGLYFLVYFAYQRWNQDFPSTRLFASSPGWLVSTIAVVAGVPIGFGYQTTLNRINARYQAEDLLGGYLWEIIKASGYVFCAAVVLLIALRLQDRRRIVFVSLTLTVLLAISGGTAIDDYRRLINYGVGNYENWGGNSAPFSTANLRLLGDFVRDNTNSDAVLASNNFCCAGKSWWQEVLVDPKSHASSVSGETKWGGANYLASAETRRRFLIQGLRFQTGYDLPTSEQMNRMTLSLDFANTPSASSLRRLKAYGVSGYVVNLSLTEHRDWSEFAIERFQSGNFVYLELR
jgi:hypothetical protein